MGEITLKAAHYQELSVIKIIKRLRGDDHRTQRRLHAPVTARLAAVLHVAEGRLGIHAENKVVGRMIPFLVLGSWDKNTIMPYCRSFPAATGDLDMRFKLKGA